MVYPCLSSEGDRCSVKLIILKQCNLKPYLDLLGGVCHGTPKLFTSQPHQELAGMACSPNVPETSTFLCHGNQVDSNTYRLRILDPLKGQLCEFMNLKKNPVVFSSAVSVIRKHFKLF